jgi:asparagine synthase (glutamine-hydrolysing)
MSGFSGKMATTGRLGFPEFSPHTRGHSRQPKVFRGEGLYVIFDGEMYNEPSMVPPGALQNEAFDVARLYDQKGLDFLRDVRGSFSCVLVDAQAQRIVLAVDPFGTRPLYYASGAGFLVFGSRVSYFSLYPEVVRDIDLNAVYFYLNHSFIPAPHTIYRGVRRLQPGEFVLWEREQFSRRQYWDLSYEEDASLGEGSAAAMLQETLEQSVRVRLQNGATSNGKVGAFLSGGTDSSTLVGLMTRISGRPVKVFSVGFEEAPYDELRYARIAAQQFGSEAFEYLARAREALEIVPILAREYDEPFGNSSAIPTYCCLRMARDAGVEVMFAGDGGDELFAGNERYTKEKILSLYQSLPAGARRWLDPLAERAPAVYPFGKVRGYIRRSNQRNPDRFMAYQLFVRDRATDLLADDFRARVDADFPLHVAREHYDRTAGASALNRLLYLDMKMAIGDNDLFKVNRTAEGLGLAIQYPFLDREVAAVAGKIPARLKMKGLKKRYIFKEAFRGLLPREILRKKKHGFGLPTGHWLKSDPGFRDLAQSLLLDARSVQRGYFKRAGLENLLRQHEAEASTYYGSFIWNFMMLELWHRTHGDR